MAAKKNGLANVMNVEQFEKSVAEVRDTGEKVKKKTSKGGKEYLDIPRKKVLITLSISERSRDLLKQMAQERDVGMNQLVQQWIFEHAEK